MLESYEQRVQEDCLPAPLVDKVIQVDDQNTLIVKVNQANYGRSKFVFVYIHFQELEFWDVIVDNELLQVLLKFICMDSEELQGLCGNRNHITYRKILINNIKELWD